MLCGFETSEQMFSEALITAQYIFMILSPCYNDEIEHKLIFTIYKDAMQLNDRNLDEKCCADHLLLTKFELTLLPV